MAKLYGNKSEKLVPAKLPPAAMTAIGRLVRAFAEIEDIVNLYVGKLAQTTEGITAIFLGRMGISAKLQLAEYLSQLHGEAAKEVHKHLFDSSFSEALACRNAVAHGVFLGRKQKSKSFAFLTSNQMPPRDGKLSREVASYFLKDLKAYAKGAEEAITFLAESLGVTTSREKRFQQSLLPHRKSKPEAPRGKGPKRQPRSSRG